jgi:hypothetical protein
MATQDNVIPEWRLNRTADELRGRAKQTMIAGATIIGGIVLMFGTRRWTTADVRAVRELSIPAA